MIVVNNFAFNEEQLNFIELRRVAELGPKSFMIRILILQNKDEPMKLTLFSDDMEEVIRVYLDVLKQVAEHQGRPIPQSLLDSRADLLRKTLSLPPQNNSIGEKHPKPRLNEANVGQESPPKDFEPTGESREAGYSRPFRCLHCNTVFQQQYPGQQYCQECLEKFVEGLKNETSSSKENQTWSRKDHPQDGGNRPDEARPNDSQQIVQDAGSPNEGTPQDPISPQPKDGH